MTIFNSSEIEKKVHDIWAEEKIAEKITKMDDEKEKFYLLDGPPYVNGVPHVGHAKTTIFKDVWGRLKYMQGYSVWFQPGFDCGGLPIENKAEQLLEIKSKTDIEEKIGIDKFIETCQKIAKGNEPLWLNFYKKIGAWRGWLEPYLTSENYYGESGWWTIKQWFEKGLLTEGMRPGFWCPHCETVLAGIEASESYKNVEDPSVVLKFFVAEGEYLLVWTTTPWTLPANVAVLVHPDETYVKVKHGKEILILAEKRLSFLDEIEKDYEVVKKIKGKELAGIKYKPLMDLPVQRELEKNENAHKIYVSVPVMKKRLASKVQAKKLVAEDEEEFGHVVTMDVGTGLVHVAPGHGDVDNRIGKHYYLPEVSPVDEKGRMTEEAGIFAGLFVKKADQKIIEFLQEQGSLFYAGKITHSYPLCWRCKTPLIYRMSRQWFLKIDMLREKIIKANKKIKWLPDFARERYHNTIIGAPDWAVTRQRYWGIPLPIWTCEKCKTKKVIGSLEELQKASGKKIKDIHKNTVDKIKIKCECGSVMERENDIMDVWFDSGIAPWASLGYPFKNKKLFEHLWKVDLIDESQDQVKAWFDKLIICGFATFDEEPFQTVCLNGWTLDEKGEKMSKSLGNVVLAEDAYKELGADLLRLYICHDTSPWETQKFSLRNANDLSRTFNILLNAYNYFKTYSKIESNKYDLALEDKWILSELNSLIKETGTFLENFNIHLAARGMVKFIVDDFSRTYIKIIRDRNDKPLDYTLTKIFETVTKIMAPIAPFISEYIYHDMFNESVHLQKWPEAGEIDKNLEKDMEFVEKIVTASNAIRKENNIKLRWPLPVLYIDSEMKNNKIKQIIEILCNVKKVEFEKDPVLKKKDFEGGTVYLDINVSRDDALLRELLREIQAQRKKEKLVIEDRIVLVLNSKEMEKYEDEIKEKVGATRIKYEDIMPEDVKGKIEFEKEIIKFSFIIEK